MDIVFAFHLLYRSGILFHYISCCIYLFIQQLLI